MKFTVQRLFYTRGLAQGDYTIGFCEEAFGKFRSFTVEDTYRAVKIQDQTRIPAGLYELKIKVLDTPLTIKHRIDYNKPDNNWFKYHIEIVGIPNYAGVYIHAGNDDEHTKGCLLLNYAVDSSAPDKPGSKSTVAVEAFYKLVYPLLEANEACFIEVRDETFLKL